MDKVYLILFYFFRFVVRYTPKAVLIKILNFIAKLIYKFDKKHRNVSKVNLDLAYGNSIDEEAKAKIIKSCYKNLVFTLADFINNQGISKEELLKKVTFENGDIIEALIKEGKRVIIMTAHYGNWELLGLAISSRFIPMTSVGRELDAPSMNKILEANRSQLDMEIISKHGAMKGMIKALKNNRAVGILVDQNTKDTEGILIDFFGKKARHTPSVALLAKKFDCAIIPAFINNDDEEFKYKVKFYEPIYFQDSGDKEQDIFECVQKQADITQKVIEQNPEEWFWLHQRWKNQYENLYK